MSKLLANDGCNISDLRGLADPYKATQRSQSFGKAKNIAVIHSKSPELLLTCFFFFFFWRSGTGIFCYAYR